MTVTLAPTLKPRTTLLPNNDVYVLTAPAFLVILLLIALDVPL